MKLSFHGAPWVVRLVVAAFSLSTGLTFAQDTPAAAAPKTSTLTLGGHGAPSSVPFGLNKGRFEFQQLYEGSLFPKEGVAITAIAFSTASGYGRPPHAWTTFEMVLSDSVQKPNDLELDLARNLGKGRKVVLTRRPFEITPRADDSFDIVLPVDPPYVFRPSDGNLLVELRFGEPLARAASPIWAQAGRIERIGWAYRVPGSTIAMRNVRVGLYTKFSYVTIESLAPKKFGDASP
jgi:hypothetical protein